MEVAALYMFLCKAWPNVGSWV